MLTRNTKRLSSKTASVVKPGAGGGGSTTRGVYYVKYNNIRITPGDKPTHPLGGTPKADFLHYGSANDERCVSGKIPVT